MALARIFGDLQFFDCDELKVSPVSAGRWEIHVKNVGGEDRKFIVVGGKKSGGASNEWFCHCPEFYGEEWIPAKSMVQAIRYGVIC